MECRGCACVSRQHVPDEFSVAFWLELGSILPPKQFHPILLQIMNCNIIIFLLLCWISLIVCDKLSTSELRSLAEEASAKNELSSAVNYYSQLLSLEESQINYFQRSVCYLKQHKYSNAIHDLTEAIKFDNSFIKGYVYRAKINKITGRCDAALTDINSILSIQSNHKEATTEKPIVEKCVRLVNSANELYEKNQFESAKNRITEALDIAYDSHNLFYLRAKCNYELGDYQSVLVDTRKILQSDKTNINTLFLRGLCYYQLGEHEAAQTHYKEALKLDPEHKLVVKEAKKLKNYLKEISSGEAELNGRRYKSAFQHFANAVQIDPQHQVKLNYLYSKQCEALVGMKQGKEALSACNSALQYEENINTIMTRAEVHILLEDYQAAVNDFQKAFQQDQNNHKAHEGQYNSNNPIFLQHLHISERELNEDHFSLAVFLSLCTYLRFD
jgi:tetratricopeptide (TPR) repeat protein